MRGLGSSGKGKAPTFCVHDGALLVGAEREHGAEDGKELAPLLHAAEREELEDHVLQVLHVGDGALARLVPLQPANSQRGIILMGNKNYSFQAYLFFLIDINMACFFSIS